MPPKYFMLSRKPVPVFYQCLSKETLSNVQSEHPWHSLGPFPCVLSLNIREKSSTGPSPIPPAQELHRAMRPSLQPPFLQTRPIQSPQPLPTVQTFQFCHQLCCPPLDCIQRTPHPFETVGPRSAHSTPGETAPTTALPSLCLHPSGGWFYHRMIKIS